jgi:alpha-1,6-mannosyltransferase
LPARGDEAVGVLRDHPYLGLVGVYCGLALMLTAWWWYGRWSRSAGAGIRRAYVTLALWGAPLLVAPPMFSRDVYSYLAQGLMAGARLDVYRFGPATLGGHVAAEVPAVWQHTPSPYGPVFLAIAGAVTGAVGSHLVLGILAMRLVAVAGVVLLAVALPPLARRCGGDPAVALWLAALNPLVLVHLVGGAHNDAVMVGLLAAGLAMAVQRRVVPAVVLITAAALVKVPAAAALAVVAGLWAVQLSGRWRGVRAVAGTTVVAVGATVLVTTLGGTGYGWIAALDTPISPHNWSLTGVLGRWTAEVVLWRWIGGCAVLLVCALVWSYRERLGLVRGLGIVLFAVVAFGPALRPWYLVWGLVPLAAAAGDRVRRLTAAVCAVMTVVVLPDGFPAQPAQVALAAAGILLGGLAFLAVRTAALPSGARVARVTGAAP